MKFNNSKILKQHQKEAEIEIRKMVTTMGIEALNHFKTSFINQGFTDESLVGWKPRKREIRTFTSRAILKKTGRLQRSLRKLNNGKYAIKISSNVPYANIHNEGGVIHKKESKGHLMYYREVATNIATRNTLKRFARKRGKNAATHAMEYDVGAHDINMPKRQFVGYSRKLNQKLISMFDKKIHAIFK